MKELSLHILDIAQNSIRANSKLVKILILIKHDILEIIIQDDGCGMDEQMIKNVLDPFITSRQTRKIGLGIPLYQEISLLSGGNLIIESKVNVGTKVVATFKLDNIDRPPLGNMGQTMSVLIGCNLNCEFVFEFIKDDIKYFISTSELKDVLGNVSLNNVEVMQFIVKDVNEGIAEILQGVTI